MPTVTISAAMPILEELNCVLDTAYWEANSPNVKDSIYDSISAINKEVSELSKLSIQDHDLTYEPISAEFKIATHRINNFRQYLDGHIIRSTTLARLDHAIADVLRVTTPKQGN